MRRPQSLSSPSPGAPLRVPVCKTCRALRFSGFFFFFNDTATTEIYTLSLHDALPISQAHAPAEDGAEEGHAALPDREDLGGDRKSTRLNSSHSQISYAVFCLKKKKAA